MVLDYWMRERVDMDFEIIDNEKESLRVFLHNIFLLYTKRYGWLNREPFILPKKLKYKVVGKKEEKLLNIRELVSFHHSCFTTKEKARKEAKFFLKDILRYGDFIIKEIKAKTKIKWNTKNIKIILAAYRGGTNFNSNIIIGFYGEISKERLVKLLIHEAIHLNTQLSVEKLLEKPGIFTDANELLTVFLTNKIIDKLNDNFDLSLQHQLYHKNFPKFKNFKPSYGRFDEDLLKLQKFLNNKGLDFKYEVNKYN